MERSTKLPTRAEVSIQQRTTVIDPSSYGLQNGDIIWVYVYSNTAPDNGYNFRMYVAMTEYTIAFKPAIGLYGRHDPSAVLFKDGDVVYGIEEERLSRHKHAPETFPDSAIRACLDYRDLDLNDIAKVVLPYNPALQSKILDHYLRDMVRLDGIDSKVYHLGWTVQSQIRGQLFPTSQVESRLAEIGTPVPPIETKPHHACHAASAFHPSGFDEALVLTIDAKGEYDSTVVWRGDEDGLSRIRTYEHPNSLGLFFAVITEYLGYQMFNGEGKVMGLAPYGEENEAIKNALRDLITPGVNYDVTELTKRWGTDYGVQKLEEILGRPRNDTPGEFDQWQKDLAYIAQKFLEETVLDITRTYTNAIGTANVGLAGGVALNCKMNKRLIESDAIEPVAHDGGVALGAGWLDQSPTEVSQIKHAYLGSEYDTDEIIGILETNKIEYERPDDLQRYVAERLADGALVGWFCGRMEMGPCALGSRSILADPRTRASRDRVNRFVKHREEWRPFAPSILKDTAADYLENSRPAPFMITASDVKSEKRDDIEAVLHPADDSTRPQTVCKEQHPRYYRLISEFADITDVPVILNTSFNDHAEPIIETPTQALKDFFGMGLDVLVLEDVVIEK